MTHLQQNEIEEEQEIIAQLASIKPSECACNECANMCKRCPCIGTPTDIKKIIEAGHRSKLQSTYWATGLRLGLPVIEMVAPLQLPNGRCAFLTDNDLCSLHASGLKPTEGKLTSSHGTGNKGIVPPIFLTAATWTFKRYKNEIAFCNFFINK